MLLYQIHSKIQIHSKKSFKNKKFKISAPTWSEEFELPDGSYCI